MKKPVLQSKKTDAQTEFTLEKYLQLSKLSKEKKLFANTLKVTLGAGIFLGLPPTEGIAQVTTINGFNTLSTTSGTALIFQMPAGINNISATATSSYMQIAEAPYVNNGNFQFKKNGGYMAVVNVGDCFSAGNTGGGWAGPVGIITSGTGVNGPFSGANNADGYVAFRFTQGGPSDWKYGFMKLNIRSTQFGTHKIAPQFAQFNNTVGGQICVAATALPVEMISFSQKTEKESVKLNWETASEINNAGFELQRSMDGKNFSTLSFIDGNGSSQQRHEYSFVDENVSTNQLYYYRLKQIDYDGGFEYSEVITAKIEGAGNTSTFFPNPAVNGQTVLSYSAIQEGELNIQVFDAAGKALLQENRAVVKGDNRIDLDFSHLGTGMLFVKLEQNEQSSYQKLILE